MKTAFKAVLTVAIACLLLCMVKFHLDMEDGKKAADVGFTAMEIVYVLSVVAIWMG